MPDARRVQRDQQRKSIMDFVRQDSKELIRQVSGNDIRKLDEYFSAIRDIELRIDSAEKFPPLQSPDYVVPAEIPADYQEHLRLMMDMIVLAFQTDVTRIVTFVLANEGSNKLMALDRYDWISPDMYKSHRAGSVAEPVRIPRAFPSLPSIPTTNCLEGIEFQASRPSRKNRHPHSNCYQFSVSTLS